MSDLEISDFINMKKKTSCSVIRLNFLFSSGKLVVPSLYTLSNKIDCVNLFVAVVNPGIS